jgi:hypothetical protein
MDNIPIDQEIFEEVLREIKRLKEKNDKPSE